MLLALLLSVSLAPAPECPAPLKAALAARAQGRSIAACNLLAQPPDCRLETVDGAIRDTSSPQLIRVTGHAVSRPTQLCAAWMNVKLTAPGSVAKPAPGTRVLANYVDGALRIELPAQVIGCDGDAVCLVLPSGRHAQGRYVEGRLVLEGLP
jgi:hypothetical protein